MERRTFLSWVGVGVLASSLPVAIAACSSEKTDTVESPTETGDAAPREDGFTVVGTVADLDANGSVSDTLNDIPVIVIRDPEDTEKLIALDATCTHQGCKVDWEAGDKSFACPCHGSKFQPDGAVKNGPAEKPLTVVEVKTDADSVLVKTS